MKPQNPAPALVPPKFRVRERDADAPKSFIEYYGIQRVIGALVGLVCVGALVWFF